jgi:putative DNA primase/helicase
MSSEAVRPFNRDLSLALDMELAREEVIQTDAGVQTAGPRENHTDAGNARRLVRLHGTDLRFVPEWGVWLHYDGQRWARDTGGGAAMALAKRAVLSMYEEAADKGDTERKAMVDHARRSEAEPRLRAMITLARSEPGIAVAPDRLDTDPWTFNVQNGTIDLRSGDLRPHRREDLIAKIAGCAYLPDATCPTWTGFLDRIMDGREEVIGFLRRAAGYALTGSTREQVIFLLHGTGANGKSTLLRVLLELLGDYGRQAPSDVLLAKRNDAHPTGIAGLHSARLVSVIEVDEGRRLAEGLVKQLTGSDRVAARFMRQDFFEYEPAFKLFLAANHKPIIRGTDLATWRRIRLVPFDVTIPPEEQDHDLADKLRTELPGILRWAVEGALEWQEGGLKPPAAVLAATDTYRAESDILGAFIAERCTMGPDEWASKDELYRSYSSWAEQAGEKPISKRAFGERIQERQGIADNRDHSRGRFWTGIGLQQAGA